MRFQDIRKMAKSMDVNTYGMKKMDVIHAIQGAENNIECYGTERVESCNEHECLWKSDCQALNSTKGNKK